MAERRRGLGRGIGALIPAAQRETKDRPIDVFFGSGATAESENDKSGSKKVSSKSKKVKKSAKAEGSTTSKRSQAPETEDVQNATSSGQSADGRSAISDEAKGHASGKGDVSANVKAKTGTSPKKQRSKDDSSESTNPSSSGNLPEETDRSRHDVTQQVTTVNGSASERQSKDKSGFVGANELAARSAATAGKISEKAVSVSAGENAAVDTGQSDDAARPSVNITEEVFVSERDDVVGRAGNDGRTDTDGKEYSPKQAGIHEHVDAPEVGVEERSGAVKHSDAVKQDGNDKRGRNVEQSDSSEWSAPEETAGTSLDERNAIASVDEVGIVLGDDKKVASESIEVADAEEWVNGKAEEAAYADRKVADAERKATDAGKTADTDHPTDETSKSVAEVGDSATEVDASAVETGGSATTDIIVANADVAASIPGTSTSFKTDMRVSEKTPEESKAHSVDSPATLDEPIVTGVGEAPTSVEHIAAVTAGASASGERTAPAANTVRRKTSVRAFDQSGAVEFSEEIPSVEVKPSVRTTVSDVGRVNDKQSGNAEIDDAGTSAQAADNGASPGDNGASSGDNGATDNETLSERDGEVLSAEASGTSDGNAGETPFENAAETALESGGEVPIENQDGTSTKDENVKLHEVDGGTLRTDAANVEKSVDTGANLSGAFEVSTDHDGRSVDEENGSSAASMIESTNSTDIPKDPTTASGAAASIVSVEDPGQPNGTVPADRESEGSDSDEVDSIDADDEGLVEVPGATYAELPLDEIIPNTRQPRNVFDEEELEELAASIREVGILQPVIVRPLSAPIPGQPKARYELIMGERRWRASELAETGTIPAIIRHTQDEDLLRDALLENLHRAELNPLEEAAAYHQLLEDFQCTQEELSRRIVRSRPQISNTLRLLKLPPLVQRRVAAGVLSAGHARALLGLSDPGAMERLAQKIVSEGLSVRQVEEIVALGDEPAASPTSSRRRTKRYGPELGELSTRLADRFDTRVKVEMGAKKGSIKIDFASIDDLNRILEVLTPGETGVDVVE